MTFKPLLRGVPKIVEIFIHEEKESFSRLASDFSNNVYQIKDCTTLHANSLKIIHVFSSNIKFFQKS